MGDRITFKCTSLVFLPSAFQSICNAYIQAVKAMHDYQIALKEAKHKEWPNISIIVPGNITIKGVSLPKLQKQSNKRIYGNKDIQWYYRKSPFYIPFYYPVLNLTSISDRYISKPIQTKINRNVRPKGTHSHFKFYH